MISPIASALRNTIDNTRVETDPKIVEELKKRIGEGWTVLAAEHIGTQMQVTVRLPDGEQTVITIADDPLPALQALQAQPQPMVFLDAVGPAVEENKFVPPGESNTSSRPLGQSPAIYALSLNKR